MRRTIVLLATMALTVFLTRRITFDTRTYRNPPRTPVVGTGTRSVQYRNWSGTGAGLSGANFA
jgi:hypothetical protein